MIKKFSIFLFGIMILSFASCKSSEVIAEDDGFVMFNGKEYVQTFYDDFSGTELSLRNWEKCPEWKRQDKGGYWKNECSYVKDGNLVIEAKIQDGKLLSGAVRSASRFEQNCGLYKIRFKVDQETSGLWYAFWLMGHTVNSVGNGAVDGGEIDIFEILPQPAGRENYLNSAVHWDGYGADHKSRGAKYYIPDDFYGKWHEVTFEWTKDYYKAYLDGSPTPYWDTEGQASAYGGIVEKNNYMKITAEFGTWAGKTDESALPAHMYVDYVKVYKQK